MKPILFKELRDALRNHWLQGYALLLAALGAVAGLAATSTSAGLGELVFGRTTASLTNLCLLLAPLAALSLGAATIAGERDRGTLERLLAQPLGRRDLLAGKYGGLLASLMLATLLGFLPAGVLVGVRAGAGAVTRFAVFPLLAALTIAAMLGIGVLISVRSKSAAQAQARAVFTWFGFVILYDLMLIGTLMSARVAPGILAALMLANPVNAGRTLVVLALEPDLYLLGPSGALLFDALGRGGAAAALMGSQLTWAAAGLWLAQRAFDRNGGDPRRRPRRSRKRAPATGAPRRRAAEPRRNPNEATIP